MSHVGIQGGTVHKDIVEENYDKLTQKRRQHGIHGCLEGGRCICQSKRHDQELIMTLICLEGCFQYVSFIHTNLMITSNLSSLEKIVAPPNSSNSSYAMGIRKLSRTVTALTAW